MASAKYPTKTILICQLTERFKMLLTENSIIATKLLATSNMMILKRRGTFLINR